MVRQKNRWLLVQLDFECDILSSCASSHSETTSASLQRKKKRKSGSNFSSLNEQPSQVVQQVTITTTDIYHSLQESIAQNFGIAGASTAEVQVRLYDPKVRLAIIKTTREKYPIVRSSLTVLTHIKKGGAVLKVVASTIAVSGSARTARNAAWGEIQKRFFGQDCERPGNAQKRKNTIEMNLQDLEDRLGKIDSGC